MSPSSEYLAKQGTLLIPLSTSFVSATILVCHICYLRFFYASRPVEDDALREENHVASSDSAFLGELRRHVVAFENARISAFGVARFVGCLILFGLSVASLFEQGAAGKAYERHMGLMGVLSSLGERMRDIDWPQLGTCLSFFYATLLSLLCVSLRPKYQHPSFIFRRSTHLTLLLLVTFVVYAVRDLYPLCTFTLSPLDLPHNADPRQAFTLWTMIGVLSLTAIWIPLLRPRTYTPVDAKHPSQHPAPEQTCSLISLALYTFMDSAILLANKFPPLPYNKLPPLADFDEAENLRARSFPHLDRFHPSADKAKLANRHIFWGLMRTFQIELVNMALLLVGHAVAGYIAPIGLKGLLHHIETNGHDAFLRPWVWLLWLFFGPTITAIVNQRCIFISSRNRVQLEAIICQLVFEHALRIRPYSAVSSIESEGPVSDSGPSSSGEDVRAAPKPQPSAFHTATEGNMNLTGKLNNLVSTDVANITGAGDFLLLIVYIPLQVIFGITFLYFVLGWSALVGLVTMVLLMPLPGFIGSLVQSVQQTRMQYTDQRLERVTESMLLANSAALIMMMLALSIVRTIKMLGWERAMKEKILGIRESELIWVRKKRVLELLSICINYIIPIAVMLTTYVHSTVIMRRELSASIVFSSMTVFDMLRRHLHMVSFTLSNVIRGKVSLDRVDDFLHNAELLDSLADKQGNVDETETASPSSSFLNTSLPSTSDTVQSFRENAIGMGHVHYTWTDGSVANSRAFKSKRKSVFTLRIDGNVVFKRNCINLVTGPTGSGKTALLLALLGEMRCVRLNSSSWCNLPREGGISYAAQSAWIQNDTIRNNILFGAPSDEERYNKVIHQCCLEKDFESFEARDETEVGERGLTLSGGQKARITLARAIYCRSDIVLLDDPLAALDVHTAKWIVGKCFRGDLVKGRTVILTAHNVALTAPIATFVVSLRLDGHVSQSSSTTVDPVEDPHVYESLHAELGDPKIDEDAYDGPKIIGFPGDTNIGSLVASEEIEVGHVGWPAIKMYLSGLTGHHHAVFYLIFLAGHCVTEAMFNFLTWFLGYWASQYEGHSRLDVSVGYYISVYGGLMLVAIFTYALTYFLFVYGGIRASRVIHNQLIEAMLGATLRWLDTTPVSRIITRCTQDIRSIDDGIPQSMKVLVEVTISALAKLGVIVLFAPLFLVPGIIVALLGGVIAQMYIVTQMAVKREMSNAKSPILGHLGAAMDDLASIRAYGAQEAVRREVATRIDKYTRVARSFYNFNRWINVRLDGLSNAFTLALAIYLLYFRQQRASNTGLIVNMAVGFSGMILVWVRVYNDFEVQVNSLERIGSYIHVQQELKSSIEGQPPAYWPASGDLRVVNLSARYSITGPNVLDAISFHVKSGERIGIVGRTGSGKSSLALSILRFLYTEGAVYFDGIPTNAVNLDVLRANISIIPQVPELMSGTLRQNLDPFSRSDDVSLYAALKAAGLQATDDGHRITLDTIISSGGSNFSLGQRQLIALARAIVRESKLLILDEATSAIDYESDAIIQASLRHGFRNDVTMIIVAHRLQTVIDADKIMVLDAGQLAEFGSPRELLAKKDGRLRALVDESGDRDMLVRLAGLQNS